MSRDETMAIITHKCPHQSCLTEHVALRVVSYTKYDSENRWAVYLRCPKCNNPSCGIVSPEAGSKRHAAIKEAIAEDGDLKDVGWGLVEFWPSVPGPLIPEHLHPDVARAFLQAERNFAINGNEEASGMMYRKALDVGLKKIDSNLQGPLAIKIKKLAEAGRLTRDIASWSDSVRDLGNDAAHEESPIARDDLIELRSFTEMVLRYLFTLPNMVRKRRGETLEWEQGSGEQGSG